VLFDSINIRYATGARRSTLFNFHSPSRYAIVPAEGRPLLFDYHNAKHVYCDLETISEYRPAISWCFFGSGPRYEERAQRWASEITAIVRGWARGEKRPRVAIDRLDPAGTWALDKEGIEILNGQELLEYARAIKSREELACMELAMTVCETAMQKLLEETEAGRSENELWSILHQTNIAMGGEWIDARLLVSGPRTNPWYQETSERRVRPRELIAFDTDLIGPFGYIADISRTFFCGPGKPTGQQRDLYALACEQLQRNAELLRVGVSFQEFAEKSWRIPDEFLPNRYVWLAHGAGMADEYPTIPYPEDFEKAGYDGLFEENMVICVESFIGSAKGGEGVKLEDQYLITRHGPVNLCQFPLDDKLLG
jgi:Xaa-Pro aminopeptidase